MTIHIGEVQPYEIKYWSSLLDREKHGSRIVYCYSSRCNYPHIAWVQVLSSGSLLLNLEDRFGQKCQAVVKIQNWIFPSAFGWKFPLCTGTFIYTRIISFLILKNIYFKLMRKYIWSQHYLILYIDLGQMTISFNN